MSAIRSINTLAASAGLDQALLELRGILRRLYRHALSAEMGRTVEQQDVASYATGMASEHELLRQIAFWRDLLARVADDMDQAAIREVDHHKWCESRSRRIRQLLEQPVPPGWSR